MNNIYTTSISIKRQTGDFIIKKEHYHMKEIKEIVHIIRDIFKIRGQERISRELKGFLHNYPNGSYVKFTIKLDHDFSVISSGGLLGYVSDHTYDAYDTFVFSNVDFYIPNKPLKSIEELKSKWSSIQQIVPLLEYQKDPNCLTKNKDYSTHIDYSYHPKYIQPVFSPKQVSTQHAHLQQQQMEKQEKLLSSSPTNKSLKTKSSKEANLVNSPPIAARAF
ncbi:hypothetical protein DICPUDRAFT_99748 [Dictyostelium purpureum]|uniref:Uncharacterized protein n=1 Tax=Dictyostelium purpureum TaxID=5786 RepID=F1A261_DICPU|nr:uncharacterized protein DICPUDRAFT_99748 [Dictyostelium purpureum]EGC29714.1 hypothetical protein DICPUDRAFT_99748 [Dictyostelium purpureum]|eukprot:XP_003293755.1 hypothetical protein DICPUDRAFT_99748 [Dictyostelium purpureum]